MALHKSLGVGDVHIPYQWEYANQSAREGASGFVAGDVGKLARQLDDNSIWLLTATTPTWVSIASGGTPGAHAASHQNGGGDEISVAGLSGELADAQVPKAHSLAGSEHNADTLSNLNAKVADATLIDTNDSRLSDARTPTAHASSHQNGGADEIATATPAANAIPKADGSGALDSWVTHNDSDAIHDDVAGEISAITEKANPVDADLLLIEDSADSDAKKKIQIGNLPASGGIQSVEESRVTTQISTTSTSWVTTGLTVTFTPTAGEKVLVLVAANVGNTDNGGDRTMIDVEHNNSGSFVRIGGDRGTVFIESFNAQEEKPATFAVAITLPNAVSTTVRVVYRVDGSTGFILGDQAPAVLQVVRF